MCVAEKVECESTKFDDLIPLPDDDDGDNNNNNETKLQLARKHI